MVSDFQDSSRRLRNRREVLTMLGSLGIGSLVFQKIVADEVAQKGGLTADAIAKAEWMADLVLSDDERTTLVSALSGVQQKLQKIRNIAVTTDQCPAFRFDPETGIPPEQLIGHEQPKWLKTSADKPMAAGNGESGQSATGVSLPDPTPAELSSASIVQLGQWLRSGKLTSRRLTEHCLNRLKQYDRQLFCVVTLTEALALEQADRADAEMASGIDKGPLHGIPWGAKDLIAVQGYPTTWGAPQFLEQYFDHSAAVYSKLTTAGAVLVAKLSLGALAMGDQWFGGKTRNPWNPDQGSSGSSAGSAAAVAAGLVPFALGSETLGSIISPTRRCGITSLRPTFGRVSRSGCMPLSWTMDKIGPMARTVNDCGLVLQAIQGRDYLDPASVDRWYQWPAQVDLSGLRIGQVQNKPISSVDEVIIETLQDLGATLIPVELPDQIDEWALSMVLDVEAAAVFHNLLSSGDTAELNSWPDIFRRSHFVSAVDFIHAFRIRSRLIQQMADVFQICDLYVGGSDLGITNLTGHPTVALPVSTREGKNPQPACGMLTGRLYDEATILAVAALVEQKLDVQPRIPPAFAD